MSSTERDCGNDIAIVGMEGRFPGAASLDQFWRNLRGGVESIRFLSPEPPVVRNGVAHVKATAWLDDIEWFDARFFGFNPREAETMDPQIRLFLECAWTALESAGYDPEQYGGRIGVFAGCGFSTYLTANLMANPDVMRSSGGGLSSLWQFNDRDSLATIVSYKFNLSGPSLTVQTFCSTSLVAVHLAAQSLLNGESDVALAGASSIHVASKQGYLYQEGGILSPDGHCRAFDERAAGTIFGNGVGVVVLKRLADALEEGDRIHAVIRGSAINNDGSQKAGYTAPSVVGQSKAIAEAIALAQVDPGSIGYVEAHGTGTALGDPIEIEALTQAFRAGTDKTGYCAIGSAKTNFGHLDRASGTASLIKTVLALENREIPPSLHFEKPNPKIDFESSPFFVNDRLRRWEPIGPTRIAGVSALGFGGTNAHVVLEEAPPPEPSGPSRPAQLVVLSAKTATALDEATGRLTEHLRAHPEEPLADVAFTLQTGRRRMEHRRFMIARTPDEAAAALEGRAGAKAVTGYSAETDRPVVFLFPGQGAQYAGMTRGLYEGEAEFRRHLDACCEALPALDLRSALFPAVGEEERAGERLKQTALTQPALFSVEYALARLWMSWGVEPEAMMGHSIGEYVAACLAGVFSLEDALALVAERGRLMQSLPEGSMLAVALPASEVEGWLTDALSIAAVNAPSLTVVSGPTPAVEAIEARLRDREVFCSRLHTSHAFHSAMMDPILDAFRARLGRVRLEAPRLPFVSNLTGGWIAENEARDPEYWVRHLRETVQFSEGVRTLWEKPERILLEVGPGNTLASLAQQHAGPGSERVTVASVRHPRDPQGDLDFLLGGLGRLWLAGARIDFSRFYAGERRRRVALPTYPFERERYWIDPKPRGDDARSRTGKSADLSRWFYLPSWRASLPPDAMPGGSPATEEERCWLLFRDEGGLGEALARALRERGDDVVTVRRGNRFSGSLREGFAIEPGSRSDYEALLEAIQSSGRGLTHIVHGWSVDPVAGGEPDGESFRRAQEVGFYSLLHLAQALGDLREPPPVQLKILSSEMHPVLRGDPIRPEKSTLLALARVIPQEYPFVTCAAIDLDALAWTAGEDGASIELLMAELDRQGPGEVVAHRRGQRFELGFDPIRLAGVEGTPLRLRERGAYLITGGLGGVTFVLAAYLAKKVSARLVLAGRTRLPGREEWPRWLETHGEADPVSERIRKVRQLEQWGAEVAVVSADAGDPEQMARAVEEAEKRFGSLHGVIHGAGVVGGGTFRPIQQIGRPECEQQFHPKVAGLLALERALRGKEIDFLVVTSSLSSVLGGFAYAAYAAGNLYVDALTHYRHRAGDRTWMTVNWDEWRLSADPAEDGSAGLQRYAMLPGEGAEAFHRLLQLSGVPQVVVSTGDLDLRIDQWVRLEALRTSGNEEKEESASAPRHARPNLQSAYVAPSTETERRVGAIWEELLGIEKVGIHDNFFELGGNSLLAIQLVTRIRNELRCEISVAALFEGPTVESLSRLLQRDETEPERYDQSSDRGKRRREARKQRQREHQEIVS